MELVTTQYDTVCSHYSPIQLSVATKTGFVAVDDTDVAYEHVAHLIGYMFDSVAVLFDAVNSTTPRLTVLSTHFEGPHDEEDDDGNSDNDNMFPPPPPPPGKKKQTSRGATTQSATLALVQSSKENRKNKKDSKSHNKSSNTKRSALRDVDTNIDVLPFTEANVRGFSLEHCWIKTL